MKKQYGAWPVAKNARLTGKTGLAEHPRLIGEAWLPRKTRLAEHPGRIRESRLPRELADDPVAYQEALRKLTQEVADGEPLRAIEGVA